MTGPAFFLGNEIICKKSVEKKNKKGGVVLLPEFSAEAVLDCGPGAIGAMVRSHGVPASGIDFTLLLELIGKDGGIFYGAAWLEECFLLAKW